MCYVKLNSSLAGLDVHVLEANFISAVNEFIFLVFYLSVEVVTMMIAGQLELN